MKSLGTILDSIRLLEGGRRVAPLTSRLTAAVVIASATQTPTGLQVTLDPNKVYEIVAHGSILQSATGHTWAPRINFAGTTTRIRVSMRCNLSAAVSNSQVVTANASAFAHVMSGTIVLPWTLDGEIVVGATGGVLAFEHARTVGAANLTVGSDSILKALEIA